MDFSNEGSKKELGLVGATETELINRIRQDKASMNLLSANYQTLNEHSIGTSTVSILDGAGRPNFNYLNKIKVMAHTDEIARLNFDIEKGSPSGKESAQKQKMSCSEHLREELSSLEDKDIQSMLAQFQKSAEILEKELKLRAATRQTAQENSL